MKVLVQGYEWSDVAAQRRIIAAFEALPDSSCGACGADGETYGAACANDWRATPVYAPGERTAE